MTKTRMPWHDEPFVDRKAAHKTAIDAAKYQPGDIDSPAVKAYVSKALVEETDKLVKASERNNQLFKSSANLFELVSAGALTESEVVDALENACRTNGSIKDDGQRQFDNTLQSGRRKGLDNPRDLSGIGSGTNGFHHLDESTVQTVKLSTVFDLEQGFWTSRTSLQHIYLAALSRMCPPWAVLGYCAARALTIVRPHCKLPPVIGGPGSLNWFCAIAAPSGGGKSSSSAVAKEVVNEVVLQRNLGSGEGVIDAYVKPANKETGEPKGLHESIMFVAGESDMMAALSQRVGTTLNPTLRDAFTAEKLGFSNRQASDLHLEDHSYRMTLVVNVQPGKAGTLLDDKHGGMLQRFMWFPGTDRRISAQIPEMPGALDLPSRNKWIYPRTLEIPYEAKELIIDERVRNAHGEADPLAGHSLFIREKFAYALAVLDGRDEMTYDDWRLAGIASRVSDKTREWVVSELITAERDEAAKKGELLGVSQSAAEDSKANAQRDRLNRISKTLLKAFDKADDHTMTKRDVSRAIAGRDRVWLPTVLERLIDQGQIAKVDDKKAEKWKRIDE